MFSARAPFAHTRHVPTVIGALAVLSSRPLLLLVLVALPCCGGSGGEDASGTAGTSGDACPNDLPDRAECEDGAPSYGDDVAPIIDERCNGCHYPGNAQTAAVWSDYDAVYARRITLQSRIYSCVMPPESAPALEPAERAVLLEWLVCGAPE